MQVVIEIDTIHVVDEADGSGNAEPFLWPLFFKIDGDMMRSLGETYDVLVDRRVVTAPGGSHGNLGDRSYDAGADISVPTSIGRHWTQLVPMFDIDGLIFPLPTSSLTVGAVIVLLEEDDAPSDSEIRRQYRETFAPEIAVRLQQKVRCEMRAAGLAVPGSEIGECPEEEGEDTSDPETEIGKQLKEKLTHWIVNVDDFIGAGFLSWTWDDLERLPQQEFRRRWTSRTGSEDGAFNLYGRVRARIGLTGRPAVCTIPGDDSSQHVIVRSEGGHLHHLQRRRSTGIWERIHQSSQAGDEPVLTDYDASINFWSNDGNEHVVVASKVGIVEWWGAPGRWHRRNLSDELTLVPPVGSPHAYASSTVQHVVYRGTDSHIYELFYNTRWNVKDLTVHGEGVGAAGAPQGIWSPREPNILRVFYRGTDQHIHQLAYDRNLRRWQDDDLTQLTQTPIANSDPVAYDSTNIESVCVVFRSGSDIHRLRQTGTGWVASNLTLNVSAPVAVGVPFGFEYSTDSSERVLYRDPDGGVHMISLWNGGSRWQLTRLLDRSEGSVDRAAGDPSGYEFFEDRSIHVMFVGAEGRLVELRYSAAVPRWRVRDLSTEVGLSFPPEDV